jgi:prepilin peptidase CpaA
MTGALFAGSALRFAAGGVFTLLLAYACVSDLRTRRIPNALVVLIAVCGVAFSIVISPVVSGMVRSGGGLLTGLVIWLPFWLLGWLGAGDVKLFAAAGSWLGAWGAVQAAAIAALVGAVLTIGWLLLERGWRSAARTFWIATVYPRILQGPSKIERNPKRLVPYGLALAIGLVAVGWSPVLPFLK